MTSNKPTRGGIEPVRLGEQGGQKECLVTDQVGVTGGAYLISDEDNRKYVFKPADEEAFEIRMDKKIPKRRGISYGLTSLKEHAAYLLDHDSFAGVPATSLVKSVWLKEGCVHQNCGRTLTEGGGLEPVEGPVKVLEQFSNPNDSPETEEPIDIAEDLEGKINRRREVLNALLKARGSSLPEEDESRLRQALIHKHEIDRYVRLLHNFRLSRKSSRSSQGSRDHPNDKKGSSAEDTTKGRVLVRRVPSCDGKDSSSRYTQTRNAESVGSVQVYVPNIGCADDYGSSMFDTEDVHRIGALDIRLFNMDRHLGNLLVSRRDSSSSNGNSSSNGSQNLREGPSKTMRLVPIDHAYTLPDFRELSDANFEWLTWKQAREPFSQETKDYLLSLDPFFDASALRRLGLPEESATTVVITTLFLQRCIACGLCLAEIGEMVQREGLGEKESILEKVVASATEEFNMTNEIGFIDGIGKTPKRPQAARKPLSAVTKAKNHSKVKSLRNLTPGRVQFGNINESFGSPGGAGTPSLRKLLGHSKRKAYFHRSKFLVAQRKQLDEEILRSAANASRSKVSDEIKVTPKSKGEENERGKSSQKWIREKCNSRIHNAYDLRWSRKAKLFLEIVAGVIDRTVQERLV